MNFTHIFFKRFTSFLCLLLPPISGCYAHATSQTRILHPKLEIGFLNQETSYPLFISYSRSFLVGSPHQNYKISLKNRRNQRVEVLISVDGQNVVSSQPFSPRTQRGYVLQPFGHLVIPGFRTNMSEVRAFQFSPVHSSIGNRNGTAGDIGTILIQVYEEKEETTSPYWIPRNSDRSKSKQGKPNQEHSFSDKKSGSSPSQSPKRGAPLRTWRRPPLNDFHQEPHLGTQKGHVVYAPASWTEFVRRTTLPQKEFRILYDSCDGWRRKGRSFCKNTFFVPR